MKQRQDRLDVLARRLNGAAPQRDEPPSTASAEERLTRGTAVRLAVVGLASLVTAQWQTPAAAAQQGLGECLTGCLNGNETWLDEQIDACNKVFLPENFVQWPKWRQYLNQLVVPGEAVASQLDVACLLLALNRKTDKDKACLPKCRKKCSKLQVRSLQGGSRKGDVCEAPPPPRNYTPDVPPAPSPTQDACWACREGSKNIPVTCCVGPDFEVCTCAAAEVQPTCGPGC